MRAAPAGRGRGALNPIIALAASMMFVVATFIGAAQAQGVTLLSPPKSVAPTAKQAPPSSAVSKPSHIRVVREGNKLSKFIGVRIFDEANDPIGSIRDLIVLPNETSVFAVVSVGDFLGTGSHYVVVSFSALRMRARQIVLRDATRKSVKALPEYKYPT
jgi:hypothetical protein